MPADLVAFKLKTHLNTMLRDNLMWEYSDQIEQWKVYLEKVVDAAKSAADAQEATLRAAQEAKERAFAFAMGLLSMFAGFAVSWIGAAIAKRIAPKLTASKPHFVRQPTEMGARS